MRALRLDYQRDQRPQPWLGWGLLALTLIGLILLGDHYRDQEARIAELAARVERLARAVGEGTRATRLPDRQELRAQMLEVQNANQVLYQLGLPWDGLFAAVEASCGTDVALLAMEPDTRRGLVKIGGEAKDLDAVLTFVRQLGKRPIFTRVALQNHQVQQQDPQRPVRFSLVATWAEARP